MKACNDIKNEANDLFDPLYYTLPLPLFVDTQNKTSKVHDDPSSNINDGDDFDELEAKLRS